MPSDDQILVTCTNGECPVRIRVPLLDLQTFILIHHERGIPTHEQAQASKSEVPCPACEVEGREGTLVYLDDHLRKSSPEVDVLVPALLEAGEAGIDALWKPVEQIGTVAETVPEWLPKPHGVPTGVVLEVRPYGGFMLRHGNNDDEPQYGDGAPGVPTTKPRYIRELKHDLLYIAYYGDRERIGHESMGGAAAFEAMTVGAILALKFDLSFFYGVPTTTDLAAATLSDEQYRGITLETFSGPIYFDKAAIGDNPVQRIYDAVIRPIVSTFGTFEKGHYGIGVADQHLKRALDAYDRSLASDLTTNQRNKLREVSQNAFKAGSKHMRPTGPKAVAWPDVTGVEAVRKKRSIEGVLSHPHFAQTKRKPWEAFERELRTAAAIQPLSEASLLKPIQAVLDAEGGKGALATAAKSAMGRYEKYVEATSSLDPHTIDDVSQIIGGLPETFEPYLLALRAVSVVDHSTAIYIKSVMAGVTIGTSSGKVEHKGRKLVYRTVEGGIVGEPSSMDAFADLVIDACKGPDGKFAMPPFIMLERIKNESGFRATSRVGELGLTKAERSARVPQAGIDWSNWGGSKFFFSELFTKSVARTQELPGYLGPIVHSRGVGAGQVTMPTLMKRVSPSTRESKAYGLNWVSGIPVSADNVTLSAPGHWNGAQGSITNSSALLRKKFEDKLSKNRHCTFGNVPGGTKYDCCRCLARFDLNHGGDIARNTKGGESRSFHCKVDAPRWLEMFGEELSEDSERGRTEFPCSWLRAVQLYAGSGEKSFKRILSCSEELVRLTDPAHEDGKEKVRALRAGLNRARGLL